MRPTIAWFATINLVLVAPVRWVGWHLTSVQRDQIEVSTKSTHCYGDALATRAVNRDASDALRCLCRVGVGEITDVFSGDGIDHAQRVKVSVHCPLEARPDPLATISSIIGSSSRRPAGRPERPVRPRWQWRQRARGGVWQKAERAWCEWAPDAFVRMMDSKDRTRARHATGLR